jgi:Tfp pilus assembly protein PilF
MKLNQMVSASASARLRQRCQEAWLRQDYPLYFKLMEQARRLDPANPVLWLDLGASYGMRYDYAAAERCFEKAVRVGSNRLDSLVMAAIKCRGFERYEMARHYLERAVQEPGASADTHVKLAEVYERFHLLEAAGELVDKALHLDPASILACLARARLSRLSGRLGEAETLLRTFLSRSDRETWSTRIRGWYELGAVLDAQGRYNEAMEAFVQAKNLILPNAGQLIAGQKLVQSNLRIAVEKLNPEMMNRWREQGRALQPPVRLALLCGHPRSGTTLLEQVMDSHPGLVSAEETTVFNRESFGFLLRGGPPGRLLLDTLEAAAPASLRQARANYSHCMSRFLGHPPDARLLIDKNPSLTPLVPAFARIFPEAKFLVALRDPRDVCLSCFMQPLPLGQVSSIFLTLEGSAQEYASVMGLWRAAAPCLPGSCLEIRYEDLVADLADTARRALEFLGAGWDDRVLRFDEHARGKLVRSPTHAAVAKPISKGAIGRWRNYQKYLEPWLETLAPFITAFGYE